MKRGMAKQLQFYFDIGSPWAYLASMRLPKLEAATGVAAQWCPLLLGGVFRSTGNHAPIEVPAKARYLLTDLLRCTKHFGIPFQMNSQFPVNTLNVMRVAMAAKQLQPAGAMRLYTELFRALWQDNVDLSHAQALQQVVTQAWPAGGAELLAAAQSQPIKDALRQETDRAVERGVFGAPTFFVQSGERTEMFFGQDRIDLLQLALQTG